MARSLVVRGPRARRASRRRLRKRHRRPRRARRRRRGRSAPYDARAYRPRGARVAGARLRRCGGSTSDGLGAAMAISARVTLGPSASRRNSAPVFHGAGPRFEIVRTSTHDRRAGAARARAAPALGGSRRAVRARFGGEVPWRRPREPRWADPEPWPPGRSRRSRRSASTRVFSSRRARAIARARRRRRRRRGRSGGGVIAGGSLSSIGAHFADARRSEAGAGARGCRPRRRSSAAASRRARSIVTRCTCGSRRRAHASARDGCRARGPWPRERAPALGAAVARASSLPPGTSGAAIAEDEAEPRMAAGADDARASASSSTRGSERARRAAEVVARAARQGSVTGGEAADAPRARSAAARRARRRHGQRRVVGGVTSRPSGARPSSAARRAKRRRARAAAAVGPRRRSLRLGWHTCRHARERRALRQPVHRASRRPARGALAAPARGRRRTRARRRAAAAAAAARSEPPSSCSSADAARAGRLARRRAARRRRAFPALARAAVRGSATPRLAVSSPARGRSRRCGASPARASGGELGHASDGARRMRVQGSAARSSCGFRVRGQRSARAISVVSRRGSIARPTRRAVLLKRPPWRRTGVASAGDAAVAARGRPPARYAAGPRLLRRRRLGGSRSWSPRPRAPQLWSSIVGAPLLGRRRGTCQPGRVHAQPPPPTRAARCSPGCRAQFLGRRATPRLRRCSAGKATVRGVRRAQRPGAVAPRAL